MYAKVVIAKFSKEQVVKGMDWLLR